MAAHHHRYCALNLLCHITQMLFLLCTNPSVSISSRILLYAGTLKNSCLPVVGLEQRTPLHILYHPFDHCPYIWCGNSIARFSTMHSILPIIFFEPKQNIMDKSILDLVSWCISHLLGVYYQVHPCHKYI